MSKMQGVISSFKDEYRFLSNFYHVAAGVMYEGVKFPTVEHAYQAAKAFFASPKRNRKILYAYAALPTPGMAKALGEIVPVAAEWQAAKVAIMRDLLSQKFNDPVLRRLLLSTKDCELIEGNTWGDIFWGVCDGAGENNLGKLLMELRTEISWSVLVSC